jgi:hypothetical protein
MVWTPTNIYDPRTHGQYGDYLYATYANPADQQGEGINQSRYVLNQDPGLLGLRRYAVDQIANKYGIDLGDPNQSGSLANLYTYDALNRQGPWTWNLGLIEQGLAGSAGKAYDPNSALFRGDIGFDQFAKALMDSGKLRRRDEQVGIGANDKRPGDYMLDWADPALASRYGTAGTGFSGLSIFDPSRSLQNSQQGNTTTTYSPEYLAYVNANDPYAANLGNGLFLSGLGGGNYDPTTGARPTDRPDLINAVTANNGQIRSDVTYTPDDSGGFFSMLAPIALGALLGPAGIGLGSSLGLGAIGSGALVGGLTSALTGGDPLQGALFGGLGGGIFGGGEGGFADTAFDGGGSFFDGNYMPQDFLAGGSGADTWLGGAGGDALASDGGAFSGIPDSFGPTQWTPNVGGIPAGYVPDAGTATGWNSINPATGAASLIGAPLLPGAGQPSYTSPAGANPGGIPGGYVPDAGTATGTNIINPTTGTAAGAAGMGLLDTITSGAGNLLGRVGDSIMNNPLQWAALAGGALLGSQNGAQQSGTSTTTQTPWAAQQPYLLDLFAKAKLANETAGTDLSPLQQQAMTQAGQTNPLQAPATETMRQAITGQLRNPTLGQNNPYLQETIDNANADVSRAMLPAINAANRASGSFGNSGVADYYGKSLTDAYSKNATGMRFADYTNQQQLNESDIARRMSAAMNAPTFVGNNLANAQNMFTLGTQAKTDPFNTLGKYGSLIGGSYGSATNSPIFTNPTAGLLGGALAGSQVYNSLFKQG